MSKTEFDYLMNTIDISKHIGKWIAVVDKHVVTGESGREAFDKAKEKYPDRDPLVMKVPTETVMLL